MSLVSPTLWKFNIQLLEHPFNIQWGLDGRLEICECVLFVSQMLLGMYRCTDIPGKFVWQPGTLTQAVSKGQWILLEDIDHAPLDVVSLNLLGTIYYMALIF